MHGTLRFRSMVRRSSMVRLRRRAMSRARLLGHVATIGLITGLLLAAFLPSAHAGPGDPLLPPVTIDPLAQCLNGGVLEPGTAIALVQGSKVNPSFPTIPVLLVTSCHTVNPGVLHFLDTAGVRKATITTSVVPANGWGALALRADKGDLLACANRNASDEHLIYTIDYNGLSAVPPMARPPSCSPYRPTVSPSATGSPGTRAPTRSTRRTRRFFPTKRSPSPPSAASARAAPCCCRRCPSRPAAATAGLPSPGAACC